MAIIIFVIIAVFLFTFGNYFWYKWTINKAIKKHIAPYFRRKGYKILKKEFPGLLSTGAFEREFSLGFYTNIDPRRYDFVDITARNIEGRTVKVTARIETIFGFYIRNVAYKEYIRKIT